MSEHGAWYDRISLAITHAPKFTAGLGIVRAHRSAAGADDLLLSFDRDRQRCAERKSLAGSRFAADLPKHFARVLVQRHDERVAFSITTEDQCVVHERGRPAVAVNRRIREARIPPKNLAVQIQASRSVVPKVGIEPFIFN